MQRGSVFFSFKKQYSYDVTSTHNIKVHCPLPSLQTQIWPPSNKSLHDPLFIQRLVLSQGGAAVVRGVSVVHTGHPSVVQTGHGSHVLASGVVHGGQSAGVGHPVVVGMVVVSQQYCKRANHYLLTLS